MRIDWVVTADSASYPRWLNTLGARANCRSTYFSSTEQTVGSWMYEPPNSSVRLVIHAEGALLEEPLPLCSHASQILFQETCPISGRRGLVRTGHHAGHSKLRSHPKGVFDVGRERRQEDQLHFQAEAGIQLDYLIRKADASPNINTRKRAILGSVAMPLLSRPSYVRTASKNRSHAARDSYAQIRVLILHATWRKLGSPAPRSSKKARTFRPARPRSGSRRWPRSAACCSATTAR